MGYILFVRRDNVYNAFDSDVLPDPGYEDDLASFAKGDWVTLRLHVPLETGERIARLLPLPAVQAQPYVPPPLLEDRPPRYEIEIAAVVVGKTHMIVPDWMNDDERGLRVSAHTIVVQCESDEAEAILQWIRSGEEPAWVREKLQ